MKFNLHNKYEITIGDKKYVAYNTLLNTIYNKISNLEQYTSHIALGTGLSEKTTLDTKLSNYLMSFKASTEEIQCDPSKDVLFIKKVVSIDESYSETFSFSELGITDTGNFDPIIFNHVLLKNKDGEPISITRNQGDALEIKVTIYIELNSESKNLFIQGENELIKSLLGEELDLIDNNLYAIRGSNLLSTEKQFSSSINLDNAFPCEKDITANNDGSINLNYSAELGEGDTEEILLVFNNKVCLRLNTLEINSPTEITNTFVYQEGNFIDVDKNIKNINSVYLISDSGNTIHNTHKEVCYSKTLANKMVDLFDISPNNSTPRFVSKDGKMIGFIIDSYFHLYKYENYDFTKINTTQVSLQNIMKLFMFEDIILILKTDSPYIEVYKIENNNAVKKDVSLSMYDASVYPYSWLDADATLTLNNKILIGIILNNETQTPVVITLTQNEQGNYTDDFIRANLDTAKKVYAVYKNNFTEPRVSFLTDTYSGGTYYLLEEYFESSSQFSANSDIAYNILNNSQEIIVSGRTILSQKNKSPYLTVYYYPDFIGNVTNFSEGIKHYASKDGNYIIAKYSDNSFKIFNLHNLNSLTEFESDLSNLITFSEVLDFEFVGDLLLVFSSNTKEQLFAYALKNNYLRIENLSSDSNDYLINYNKYNLLGSKPLEGVKVNFNINFSASGD